MLPVTVGVRRHICRQHVWLALTTTMNGLRNGELVQFTDSASVKSPRASVFACSQPEEAHDSNNQSKFICIAPFIHKRQPKEECCNLIRLTSNSTATFKSSINLHPIFSCCVEIRGGEKKPTLNTKMWIKLGLYY